MSEPIKLPPLPDTEYTLAVPAAPYEPAWISSMEAWDESAMENYATLAVEQATAELRAERDALRVPCRTLVSLLETDDWQATLRLAVEQARAALKETK